MGGALLALASAAAFGLNSASLRRGVVTSSVFQALAITVPVGVPMFLLVAVAFGQWDAIFAFDGVHYLWLSLAGIFHFVWGRYCGYRAIKAMGANLAGPVQQCNLLVAMTLSIALLGETLTVLKIAGIALVLAGPAIMVMGRRARPRAKAAEAADPASANPGAAEASAPAAKPATPKFEPNLVEGYTFALLTMTGYGLSPIFVRLGLEGVGMEAALAGGVVSYVAASLFFCLLLIPAGRVVHVLRMDRRALPWFVNSGVFVGIAQIFRYLALAIAPVTVVAPILRTSMVFRTVFTSIINRDHEVLDAKVVVGMALSLAGAVLLALQIDVVAAWLPLPDAAIRWRWP